MIDQNRTHGLWAKTAPKGPDLKRAQGNLTTEVVIIGAGYTGLSAGLHLAKMGKESIILEAENVGFGGAGRNVGLVNAGLWLMPEDVVKLVGEEHGERLIKVLGASADLVFGLIDEYDIPCEALRNGTLHCADSRAGLKALRQREAQWLERGAPVQLLDKDKTQEFTGTNVFRGALLDHRAGTLQPLAYANGLAHAAVKEGVQIFKESPVIAFEKSAQGWQINTPAAKVQAKALIIAVHGYAEHAFKAYQKNMVPFNFFQFATEPLSDSALETILPQRNGAWDTNLILSSYRVDQQGRLVVGSVGMADGFAHGLHENWVKRTIQKTFPKAGNPKIEYGWHGRIAMTTDHIPRFHVLDHNMAMVTCYNGRGIGPGTVFGKLLADYITTGFVDTIPLPVSAVKPVDFKALRGLFYEAGARMYHFIQRRI